VRSATVGAAHGNDGYTGLHDHQGACALSLTVCELYSLSAAQRAVSRLFAYSSTSRVSA
jgi:hypothetical protein